MHWTWLFLLLPFDGINFDSNLTYTVPPNAECLVEAKASVDKIKRKSRGKIKQSLVMRPEVEAVLLDSEYKKCLSKHREYVK